MKVIKVELTNDAILEKVYEYFISQCERFFNVKNEDLPFYFIPNDKNCEISIGICREDSLNFCEELLDNAELDYTGTTYVRVFPTQELNEFIVCNGVEILPKNEIRYIKLHTNDVIKISIEILSKLLKTNCKNVKVIKTASGYAFYFAANYQLLLNLDEAGLNEATDYTDKIKDLFM